MADIEFKIVERIGLIAEGGKGWTKELNLVSWNGRDPKFDIREWDPAHEKMGKGVTLTKDEAKALLGLLAKRFAEA
jgi:hypothetical protein